MCDPYIVDQGIRPAVTSRCHTNSTRGDSHPPYTRKAWQSQACADESHKHFHKGKNHKKRRAMKSAGHHLVDDVTKLNSLLIHRLLEHSSIEQAWYYNGAVYGKTLTGRKLKFDVHDDICSVIKNTKNYR